MPVADVEPCEAGGFGSVEAALGVGLAGRRQVGQQEIRPEGQQGIGDAGGLRVHGGGKFLGRNAPAARRAQPETPVLTIEAIDREHSLKLAMFHPLAVRPPARRRRF